MKHQYVRLIENKNPDMTREDIEKVITRNSVNGADGVANSLNMVKQKNES